MSWLRLPLAVSGLVCGLILWYFHNRFWWGPDEGAYLYVAQQMNAGETYTQGVTDIHPGLVHHIHALALRLFGDQFVSLRYFLAAGFWVGALTVHHIVEKIHGWQAAISAAVGFVSLSFVLFLNPSANWYSLLFVLALGCIVSNTDKSTRWRLYVVGAGVAVIFLTRQLSGVLAAMALVAMLLYETDSSLVKRNRRDGLLAAGIAACMALGLGFYLVSRTNIDSLAIVGLWPLLIFCLLALRPQLNKKDSLLLVGKLSAGFFAVLAPLVCYLAFSGLLDGWLDATFGSATSFAQQGWINDPSFLNELKAGLDGLMNARDVTTIVLTLFWVTLVLNPAVLGIRVVRKMIRNEFVHPLALLAVVWSTISVHYQIPIYLFFVTASTLLGHIVVTTPKGNFSRVLVGVPAIMAALALVFFAGQPLYRPHEAAMAGVRFPLVEDSAMGTGLWLPAKDIEPYSRLLEIIESNTAQQDPILALPTNPEIYSISGRQSPLWFFNATFGLRSGEDIDRAIAVITKEPPKVVIHRPDDKYRTSESDRLLAVAVKRLTLSDQIDGFDVYTAKK